MLANVADDPFITMSLSLVFLIGFLWAGWANGVKTWIAGKVAEGAPGGVAAATASASSAANSSSAPAVTALPGATNFPGPSIPTLGHGVFSWLGRWYRVAFQGEGWRTDRWQAGQWVQINQTDPVFSDAGFRAQVDAALNPIGVGLLTP